MADKHSCRKDAFYAARHKMITVRGSRYAWIQQGLVFVLFLTDLVLYWQECISGMPSTIRSCVLLNWTLPHVS